MTAYRIGAIAALAISTLAACQSAAGAPVQPEADPAAAVLSGGACPDMGEGGYIFWMGPRSAQPGETVTLYPYFTQMPGAYEELPAGCLGEVSVTPAGLAALSRDAQGVAAVTVADDAPDGQTLRVSGAYPGGGSLAGRIEIYTAEAHPLVGTWHQESEGCPDESAVRELVFTAGGEFSVTWTPFETYTDYWGDYDYDPSTGAVRLRVEGGNQVPPDIVADGTATVGQGVLTFDALSFGTPDAASGTCQGGFRR